MRTLLVVDDDESILGTYGSALRHAGYNVFTAVTGTQGIELARRHLPDLILCDINMPGLDGRNVLQTLREDANLALKQIVLMTGNTRSITSRSGMEWGADDFLVKPIEFEELLACVKARLRRAALHWRVEDRIVNDLRTSLRSTLPHEFFTPLAGMLGLVEVLREQWTGLQPAEIADVLAEIDHSGWRLHRTLKNYLLALELEGKLKSDKTECSALSRADLQNAISSGIENVDKRRHRSNDISLQIGARTVYANAADLAVIVEELVENACSFSQPGTSIQVRLSAEGVMSVSDQGRGMTAEQIQQIGAFQQFDRKKFEQQGLGLGLVIVRNLTALCGATLLVESKAGEGTTVKVAFVPSTQATGTLNQLPK